MYVCACACVKKKKCDAESSLIFISVFICSNPVSKLGGLTNQCLRPANSLRLYFFPAVMPDGITGVSVLC